MAASAALNAQEKRLKKKQKQKKRFGPIHLYTVI